MIKTLHSSGPEVCLVTFKKHLFWTDGLMKVSWMKQWTRAFGLSSLDTEIMLARETGSFSEYTPTCVLCLAQKCPWRGRRLLHKASVLEMERGRKWPSIAWVSQWDGLVSSFGFLAKRYLSVCEVLRYCQTQVSIDIFWGKSVACFFFFLLFFVFHFQRLPFKSQQFIASL